jgi:triacylglycerol lipase
MKKFDNKTTEFSVNNAYWLAWCSRLAYYNENTIAVSLEDEGMRLVEFFDEQNTQAFICADDDKIIISVRGTDGLADAMTDINVDLVDGVGGRVHEGFNTSATRLWKTIMNQIQHRGSRSLFITGHSLGAGIATILTARLVQQKDEPVNGLYTFGQPRTGDRKFAKSFNYSFGERTFRFVNNNDVVTRTPFRSMGYSHVGRLVYFDEHGQVRNDIGWWEKLLDRITGRINDLFERGTDGIKDHGVSEYVEITGRMIC